MIVSIIEVFSSSLIMVLLSTYIWNNLDNSSNKWMNKELLIKFFVCSIFVTINYLLMDDFIKPFIATIIMMIYYYSFNKNEIKKTVVLPVYSQLLILVSELIFAFFIIRILGANAETVLNSYFGKFLSSFAISFICIIISKFNITNRLYSKIINGTNSIKEKHLIFVSIILIIILNFLTALVYYKISLLSLLILNTIIIVIYASFLFVYLKTNNNYLKIYDKYTTTFNSLKEYEDILSRYRISNHENKNQLLTIRAMANNKKITSYIDEIIENKIKDSEKLMFDSMVIPEGGLRGLIYSKMLLMKEKNIECELSVDKIIKTTDLTSISNDLMLSICNIIGVYLDNAIEAVQELDNKYIIIEIYLDDTLNIAITNNYNNNIDIDNIDNVGYSTKGENHGYGLSLVKEIIDNNPNISNIRRITDNEFTQEIRIKYQK